MTENKCLYFKEPDSILYKFLERHSTHEFYTDVVDRFKVKYECTYSPSHYKKNYLEQLQNSQVGEYFFNHCLL